MSFETPYHGILFIFLTLFLNLSAIWLSKLSENRTNSALPMFVSTAGFNVLSAQSTQVSVCPSVRLKVNIGIFVPSFFFDWNKHLTNKNACLHLKLVVHSKLSYFCFQHFHDLSLRMFVMCQLQMVKVIDQR